MKKLSKLKLKEFCEMSDSEMKNVVGGYFDPWDGAGTGNIDGGSGEVPGRCKANGCNSAKDCSPSQMCATHEDCPSIETYGKRRCF